MRRIVAASALVLASALANTGSAVAAATRTAAVRHLTAHCVNITRVPYRCAGVALDGYEGYWATSGGGGRWYGGYFATNGRTYRCTVYVYGSGGSGGVFC